MKKRYSPYWLVFSTTVFLASTIKSYNAFMLTPSKFQLGPDLPSHHESAKDTCLIRTVNPLRKSPARKARNGDGDGENELERLRQENERLKRELTGKKKNKRTSGGFNPLKAIGEIFLPKLKSAADKGDDDDIEQGETEIVTSRSSKKQRERSRAMQRGGTDAGSAIDELFKDVPFPLNLAGGLVKGVASMVGDTFQEAEDDVDMVVRATEKALRRDEQASLMLGGGDATCSSPVGQSYSKSTINGVSSTSVSLQLPVRGNSKQGLLSVKASVGAGRGPSNSVDVQSIQLTVDGRSISVNPKRVENPSRRAPGSGDGGGNFVDVEYTET